MTRSVSKGEDSPRLPQGCRVACCRSSYHEEIPRAMRDSAFDVLAAAGLDAADFLETEVPGAFELPLVAQRYARRTDVSAVLCFGLVLKGETEHDRYIAQAVAEGLMRVGLATDTPVLFGVLTCASLDQARTRARRESDGGLDKGREVAVAAIEVLSALEEASASARRGSAPRKRELRKEVR